MWRALLRLTGNSSTNGVGDLLASSAAPLVLLMQPGYALRPELRDAFLAATEQLQLSDAVGFVSYVATSDGTVLYPQPPYYVPHMRGPAAVLLVRRAGGAPARHPGAAAVVRGARAAAGCDRLPAAPGWRGRPRAAVVCRAPDLNSGCTAVSERR
jgi:hypothetical protein